MAKVVKSSLRLRNTACALTIDLKNAFNCVSREAVLRAASGTPISKYTQWAYGNTSLLRFGKHVLLSSSGVQQGDPSGPLLFAMALSNALQAVRSLFPVGVTDLWYADDGCLLGIESDICAPFTMLTGPLSEIGLSINLRKCKLWSQHNTVSNTSIGVTAANLCESEEALAILGFPIAGKNSALVEFTKAACLKAEEALQPLSVLRHAQGEATILRHCGPTARLQHLLRFPITDLALNEIYAADLITFKHLERIVGKPLSPRSIEAASLLISSGGLGFV